MTADLRCSPFEGSTPRIHAEAWIAPTAVVLGDAEIGARTSIWFGCVLRADVSPIRIGADVNIQDGTVVHVSSRGRGTEIGDGVSIGHMALIHACTLEAASFIGMAAVVMDDVVVETGAMVAAGALVTPGKRVRAGEVWAGRPARLMRAVTAEDQAVMKRTAEDYANLARRYASDGFATGLRTATG